MKRLLSIFMIVLTLTLAACNTQTVQNISVNELEDILDEDYQFVDVRTKDEYEIQHIDEFTYNIDFFEFQIDYSMLDVLDKNKPVVLICRSGNRSFQATEILKEQGFKEIYNVVGGMNEWNR